MLLDELRTKYLMKETSGYGYRSESDALNCMKSVEVALLRYGIEGDMIGELMEAFAK